MITAKLFLCLLLSALILPTASYCQTEDGKNLYQNVQEIDGDKKLANEAKLEKLVDLKNTSEASKTNFDSAYMLTLIKIAKYEFIVHHNVELAISYTKKAVALKRSIGAVSTPILINAYFNLAYYNQDMLQYNNALHFYDTVLMLCKNGDPDNYTILARYNKTLINMALGDYQKATEESTLGISAAQQSSDTAYLVMLTNLRAYSYLYQNQLAASTADMQTAYTLSRKTNNINELATAYEIKGLLYQKTKQNDSAVYFLNAAIKTRAAIAGLFELKAIDYNNLGQLHLLTLQNYKAAKINFDKAIAFALLCNNAQRTQTLFMSYVSVAQIAGKNHKYAEAISYYNLALSSLNLQTTDFLFSNISAAQFNVVGYKDLIFSFLFSKTELLLQLYKETKQSKYLQACLQTARITDTLVTQTRYENVGEKSKLYWRSETRNFFSYVVEACFYANNVKDAFYFMEKSRAVLLNDEWNELIAAQHLPQFEAEKKEAFVRRISELQLQLATLSASGDTYTHLQNTILHCKDSLEHFIISLEKKYPLYYQYKYADEVPKLDAVQSYLGKHNQSLVYYFMNDTAIYALGISNLKTGFVKINTQGFGPATLAHFMQLCSNKEVLNNNYASFASLSQTIYTRLFKPLQISSGNVAICSDNFFIPFEALCSDAGGKNFLLYNYNFNYIYSARSLLKPYAGSTASGNFIGFAPVAFAPSLGVVNLNQSASALQNVAQFYSNNTLLTQHKATRNSFITKASRYAVVTIFSHAQADTTDKEPLLYMCDSVIHLSELQLLQKPSIQFVLLSACQTNIGKNATGEGIYSLARGFASMGIPAVSATLWKADENAIYQITTKFNEYLAGGMNKSEALKKAKIWYLDNNQNTEKTLPYYWANMVLIGTSQPIVLTQSYSTFFWIAITFILIIGFVALYLLFGKKKEKESFLKTDY